MKGSRDHLASVTLHFGQALVKRSVANVFLLLLFGFLAVLFVSLFLWAGALESEQGDFLQGLARAWNETMEDAERQWMLWMLAVITPVALLVLWRLGQARLTVRDTAIEARIPRIPTLPVLRQSDGHWKLGWDDIRRVYLILPSAGGKHPQRLGFTRLNLETDQGLFSLFVWRWFNPRGRDHRLSFAELRRLRSLDFAEVVKRSFLVRALEANGLVIEEQEGGATPSADGVATRLGEEQFDLASHRGMQIQLGLLAIAGGYALVDTFFISSYQPLETLDPGPFVLAGLVGAVIAGLLGRGAPRLERLGVGVLVVASMAAAVYPGLLRFNAATAEGQQVQYEAVAPGRFEPVHAPLPEIDLSGKKLPEYWSKHPAGTEHEFTLLRGDTGFYQLDLAPFHARTREFYRRQRENQ